MILEQQQHGPKSTPPHVHPQPFNKVAQFRSMASAHHPSSTPIPAVNNFTQARPPRFQHDLSTSAFRPTTPSRSSTPFPAEKRMQSQFPAPRPEFSPFSNIAFQQVPVSSNVEGEWGSVVVVNESTSNSSQQSSESFYSF